MATECRWMDCENPAVAVIDFVGPVKGEPTCLPCAVKFVESSYVMDGVRVRIVLEKVGE